MSEPDEEDLHHKTIKAPVDLNPMNQRVKPLTIAPDLNPTQRIMFRFRANIEGGHTHVRLFAGRNVGSLGKCGDLVFRNEEYTAFIAEVTRGKFGQSDITFMMDEQPEEADLFKGAEK